MKRIIGGKTYNTETASKIASAPFDTTDTGDSYGEDAMYQTRGGAFFLWEHEVSKYQDRHGLWHEKAKDTFRPMGREEAYLWVTTAECVEWVSDVFGDPPETGDPEPAEATIYLRLPPALKHQVEAAARAETLSVNSFLIRCLETCTAGARVRATEA